MSPRQAGFALGVLTVVFAAAMAGLSSLFGATSAPDVSVSVVIAAVAAVSAVVAVVLLLVLGSGPKQGSGGAVVLVTGIQVGAAVVGAVILVTAQVQGASTVIVGAITVFLSTIFVLMTAFWTRRAMAHNP